MSRFLDLLAGSPTVLLFTVVGLGYLLGNLRIWGFRLGIAGVLLLEAAGSKSPISTHGDVTFYTSGDPVSLRSMLPVLLREDGVVEKFEWLNDTRII